MKARGRLLLVLSLLLCTAVSSAHAAVKTFNVTGEVLGASSVPAPYGVQNGSVVQISWSVELTKAPSLQLGSPDNRSDYYDATTFMLIQIGTWSAILVATPPNGFNFTSVADDANGVLDLWHVSTRGTDNDLVLHTNLPGGFLNLSLDFYGLFGDASSNQKNPAGDPLGAYRELCLAKAADKFTLAYDVAALKAEDKSSCAGPARRRPSRWTRSPGRSTP